MNFTRALSSIVPASRAGQVADRVALPSSSRAAKIGPSATGQYYGVGGTMMAEWDAEAAVRNAYLVNVVVYRCVQIIAEIIAALPFRAGRNPDNPGNFDVNAPLARLLGPPPGGPNPDTSPNALWAHAIAQRIVTGRFGWEIEWSGAPGKSEVVALWPLIAQFLKAIPAESGNRFFSGFEYVPRGKRIMLSPEQCFYDWQPSLTDWHQAESALQAARLDISVAVMQDMYDRSFLQNDARPASMVVTQAFANDDQFRGFKDQWNGEFGGPRNAGKPIFVEFDSEDGNVAQMIDIKQLGLSQNDAEFINRYNQKFRGICIAIGVPVSKLDASGRTFDNADQEDATFWQGTILPLVTKIQEAINVRLAPMVGPEVGWFDLSQVEALQPARRFIGVSPVDAYKTGLLTKSEARSCWAFPADKADPDSDKYYVAPTPIVVAPMHQPIPGQPATPGEQPALGSGDKNVPTPEPATEPNAKPAQPTPKAIAPPKALPAARQFDWDDALDRALAKRDLVSEGGSAGVYLPPAPTVDHPRRRKKVAKTVTAQRGVLEGAWTSSIGALFQRQSDATVARLKGKRGRQILATRDVSPDAGDLFGQEFWKAATVDVTANLYRQVVAQAAGRLISQIDADYDLDSPEVGEFTTARASRLGDLITSTTYGAVRDALVDGVQAGEDADAVAERIEQVFADATTNRAPLIAATEVGSAYNASTEMIARAQQPGVIGGQEWIATEGAGARASHSAADGQVQPLGTGFLVGDITMAFPGDPSAPADDTAGCKCVLNPLTPAEMPDSTYEAPDAQQWRNVLDVERELIEIAMGEAA